MQLDFYLFVVHDFNKASSPSGSNPIAALTGCGRRVNFLGVSASVSSSVSVSKPQVGLVRGSSSQSGCNIPAQTWFRDSQVPRTAYALDISLGLFPAFDLAC